jgi:hypothetical protein
MYRSLLKNLKLVSLVLAGFSPFLVFAPEAKAQWVSVGQNVEGNTVYVSSFWSRESSPHIRIFYVKFPDDIRRRGKLMAVNCRNGAYTFKVGGDGEYFRISKDEYDWQIPYSNSMGSSVVETVCDY